MAGPGQQKHKLPYYVYKDQTGELFVGYVEEDDRVFSAKCKDGSHMFAPYSKDCACGQHHEMDVTRALSIELKNPIANKPADVPVDTKGMTSVGTADELEKANQEKKEKLKKEEQEKLEQVKKDEHERAKKEAKNPFK